jgi:hypothetical protein
MRAAWAAAVVCAACVPAPSWMPLEPGASWSYRMERGATALVGDWRVEGPAPFGGGRGYRLASPAGPTVVGWRGGVLYASMLSGTAYEPPFPVVCEGRQEWRGTVRLGSSVREASAVATGKVLKERDPVRGVRVLAVEAEVEWEGGRRAVSSTFGQGVGLLSQSQRTDGRLDYRLDLLGRG